MITLSHKASKICRQYSGYDCRKTCPLSKPCFILADDTQDKRNQRMNEAAEQLGDIDNVLTTMHPQQ